LPLTSSIRGASHPDCSRLSSSRLPAPSGSMSWVPVVVRPGIRDSHANPVPVSHRVTVQVISGMPGCLMRALLSTPMRHIESSWTRSIESVHDGQLETSDTAIHTTLVGAATWADTSIFMPPVYHLVHDGGSACQAAR